MATKPFGQGDRYHLYLFMQSHLQRLYMQGVRDGYTAAFYNERTEAHRCQSPKPIFRKTAKLAMEEAENWAKSNGVLLFERFTRETAPEWMAEFLLGGEPWNAKFDHERDSRSGVSCPGQTATA